MMDSFKGAPVQESRADAKGGPVKKTPNATPTIVVPMTGTYVKRAEALRAALEAEISRQFGPGVGFARRGSPEKPYFQWSLPEKVILSIDRHLDADPHVGVRRDDPVRQPPHDTNWKYETRNRDHDTKAYDVAGIVALAKQFVVHNRNARENHEANEAAFAKELGGIGEIPKGMSLVRDPDTGLYAFWMQTDIKRLSAKEAAATLRAARDFRAACSNGRTGLGCQYCGSLEVAGRSLHVLAEWDGKKVLSPQRPRL